MNTGDFIRNRRIELGLSQTDVAIACGVTRSSVCKWQKGDIKNAKRQKIVQLARVLQLDPMDITRVQIGYQEQQSNDTALSPEQLDLLTAYRAADQVGRQAAMMVLLANKKDSLSSKEA